MPVLKLAEPKPTKNISCCAKITFSNNQIASAPLLTSSTNNPGLSFRNINNDTRGGWCCCGGGKSWCSTLLSSTLNSSWSFSGVTSWYKPPSNYYPIRGDDDLWGGGGAKNEGTQLTSPTSSSSKTEKRNKYSNPSKKFHPLKFHHLIVIFINFTNSSSSTTCYHFRTSLVLTQITVLEKLHPKIISDIKRTSISGWVKVGGDRWPKHNKIYSSHKKRDINIKFYFISFFCSDLFFSVIFTYLDI